MGKRGEPRVFGRTHLKNHLPDMEPRWQRSAFRQRGFHNALMEDRARARRASPACSRDGPLSCDFAGRQPYRDAGKIFSNRHLGSPDGAGARPLFPRAAELPPCGHLRPDGNGLVVGTDQRRLYLYDLSAPQSPLSFPGLDAPRFASPFFAISTVDVSRDGRYLAAGISEPGVFGNISGRAMVWDFKTRKVVADLPDCLWGISEMRFAPNSKLLAVGAYDNTVRVWQAGHWQQPRCSFTTPQLSAMGRALSLAFTPDSKRLAVGGYNGPVGLYSAPDGKLIRLLIGHTVRVRSLSFAPDGRTLASGGEDAAVQLLGYRNRPGFFAR